MDCKGSEEADCGALARNRPVAFKKAGNAAVEAAINPQHRICFIATSVDACVCVSVSVCACVS